MPDTGTAPSMAPLEWLKQSLQTAVELECSTLPPYLCAMFSLEVQGFTAYNAIRCVAMEEMVHMAIAANLLAAIGGSPQIQNIKFAYPVQGLPGGVEPDLKIGLAKLSKPQLKDFMRIEMPEFLMNQANRGETYPTIAAFYRKIREVIEDNADAVRAAVKAGGPANQVADNIGFTTITSANGADPVAQMVAGIDEILEQGEGASCGTLFAGEGSEDETSHYCRFAEIYYGAGYCDPKPPVKLTPHNEELFFTGRTITWPVVKNTLAVPADGYARLVALDPNTAAVTSDLNAFDAAYASILSGLHQVWNGPADASWKTLGGAVHSMVNLRVLSCFNLILRHQIPADLVARIPELYPEEAERLRTYTDLTQPVFYGPRFLVGT